MPHLSCYSFHSVKGGVGKSTLSVITAVALAREHPGARVVLVDMDLTGTSLADVLPLEAPRWGDAGSLDLHRAPDDYIESDKVGAQIRRRGEAPPDEEPTGVPFLNDHLLFTPRRGGAREEVPLQAIGWRITKGPENLWVMPSSALPRDLVRALPVIYDEEHAAFLESRLEYLLSSLLEGGEDAYVVFDTPPTIPGLSRSVLNLAIRLSRDPKTPLSEDGFMPGALRVAKVAWDAFLVATQDLQDIRAASRWLDLVSPGDPVRLLVNRVIGNEAQRQELHLKAVPDSANPLVLDPLWVKEDGTLREIFRGEEAPPHLGSFLRQLTGEVA